MSTYNKFKPISIGGSSINTISTSAGSVSLAVSGNSYVSGNDYVAGDLTNKGNLILGTETTTTLGGVIIYTNTYGNIIFNINGVTYTLTPTILQYLLSLSSDVQTQLNTKASTSYVTTALANLVASAPTTLDTLNELATALGNDPNFATTIATALGVQTANIATNTTAITTANTNIASNATAIALKCSLSNVQANNNAFTGTNTFNSSIPTTTLTPTLASQFITKTYADSTYTTAGNIIGANNAWTGTNTFNSYLPTSTLTPSSSSQLITKAYSDGVTSGLSSTISTLPTFGGQNNWTNTNVTQGYFLTHWNLGALFDTSSNFFNGNTLGYMGGNYTSGNAECDFFNLAWGFNVATSPAWNYYKYSNHNTASLVFQICNNGSLYLPNTSAYIDISACSTGGLKVGSSTTLSPTTLSYLSTISSNAQTQITNNYNNIVTNTANIVTNTANIVTNTANITTLQGQCNQISYSGSTTTINNGVSFPSLPNALPTTNTGSKYGLELYWNKSGGAGEVDYLAMGQGAGNIAGHYFYASNSTTAPTLCMSLTPSSLNIPSGVVTTFNGNISSNSQTITPTQLGYISGLTSNAQTQITTNATNIASNTSSITTLNGQMTTANTNISAIQTITNNMTYSSAGTGATFINTGNTTVNALFVSNKLYTNTSQVLSGSSTITFPLREFYNCGTSSGTLTLPTPATANDGAHCTFYKTSLTNTITLSSGTANIYPYGSTTGVSSLSFTTTTTSLSLCTNGTNWYELNQSTGVPASVMTYNYLSGGVTYTGSVGFGGDITSLGNIFNTAGYYFGSVKARQGSAGGTGGNSINSWWTGSALQAWVDTTNIGNFTISDYRVKENINYNVASVLNRLCSIPMIEYTIKDISIFKPNGNHIGCFAHQLQETFTEYPNVVQGEKDAIQENGNIEPQSITPELVYILMKSIQELNDKVTDLQSQINILKKRAFRSSKGISWGLNTASEPTDSIFKLVLNQD